MLIDIDQHRVSYKFAQTPMFYFRVFVYFGVGKLIEPHYDLFCFCASLHFFAFFLLYVYGFFILNPLCFFICDYIILLRKIRRYTLWGIFLCVF